jgi:hypothetical protein
VAITLRLPRVWFQCMAMLSYTRTTWSSSSSPGCRRLAGTAPGCNACVNVNEVSSAHNTAMLQNSMTVQRPI